MSNPITTASNPRVGEDIGRLACEELARIRAIIPASLSYEVPDAAEAIASTFREYVKVAAEATALRKQIAALAGLRDCSIHSVSDGENGRHRIQIGCPDLSTTQDLREALDSIRKASHRSGKLVASTGSGEETKGACLTAPGSCPSGPTASRSSGFAAAIPSRGRFIDGVEDLPAEESLTENGLFALPDSIRYDIEREALGIVNVFAPDAPPALLQSIKAALLRAEKRRIRDVRAARVSNERPEAEDPKGLSPSGRQCDGEAGTPDLLAHLRAENANLRDRVREAEKGGGSAA